MTELIITEKPSAAKRIAQSLTDGKIENKIEKGVSYFVIEKNGKAITIVPAVGHLYTVAEKNKSFKYPVFELEWKPVYVDNKNSYFAKKYADVIIRESKKADSFVVACDYDIEGEVIGLNVIRYLCKQKDAKRMKFSTLTKPDLAEAYDHKSNTLDWGQAKAGETRHFLDWMWGINLSRALTLAIRRKKAYRTLSSGRVQGPALRIIVDREKEISIFVPKPYWQIKLEGKVKKGHIIAWHELDKFWEKNQVDSIFNKVKGKDGKIIDIEKTQQQQFAPPPFDLTTLQTEAYHSFGLTPKKTLEIAQDLYSRGYISYPRTSSQQLPFKIGFKRIIQALMKNPKYKDLGGKLVNKQLRPSNGKKTDPAHPAIYPTGIMPNVESVHAKLYDLIVKRFFATFGDPALRETQTIIIDVNSEKFIAKGTRTVEEGWHIFYKPYLKLKEEELPEVTKGEIVANKNIEKIEKETQPPKRYTQASIIRELEKRDLGTKSTRAQILESLYTRDYITSNPIEATKLGIITVETLHQYCPEIIEEELTKSFEEDMQKIRENKTKPDTVITKARIELTKILDNFKSMETEIGEKLAKSYFESEQERNYIAKCPICKKGSLKITHSKKNHSRFIACDKYPDCKTTFSIPNTGNIKSTDKNCEKCSYPIIEIRRGKVKQQVCINPDCESKNQNNHHAKEKCPKCKKGNLIVKKSVYGQFLACDKFPKCRYTKNL